MAEPDPKTPKTTQQTVKTLQEVHELHAKFDDEWVFLYAAYEGTRALVDRGYLQKHERETQANYDRRCADAYGFGFTQSIIDILTFYLFKKTVKRELPSKVENDELWDMYQKDCNLYNDGIDEFFAEQSRLASIMGFVGILVDKAKIALDSRQEQLDNGVYPYLSSYFPNNILDWDFDRDEYGRPRLSMVKLLEEDDKYLIWFLDHYEIWELPETEEGVQISDDMEAVLVDSQTHELEEIPFVFMVNKNWKKRPIGTSDVGDISRIDLSIIRNLSQGEEIIDYSAFPMMRKPNKEVRPDQSVEQTDDVGPTAILGFDPDNPDSKPDWLESESKDPIEAIKDWILQKIEQIYRAANIGGMAATEVQTQAKSGTALTAEFQLLNATLVRKAINLEKAEQLIAHFWYLWEYGIETAKKYDKETVIERERSYDVENLAEDLENALTAKTLVMSKKFDEALQKKVVRKMLPSWTDSQLQEIDDEIEEETQKEEDTTPEYPPLDENGNPIENNPAFGGKPAPGQPVQQQLPGQQEDGEE